MHTCKLTPRVINKVHIGPQFEYIISKCICLYKTLFHRAHHVLKHIKSQQATTQLTQLHRDDVTGPDHIRRSDVPNNVPTT